MTKKTRLIMLSVFAVLFFGITPYILLYSLGYRVDVKKLTIVATGGIYVKALPQGATITIDSKTSNTTGIFSNTVFVQNLLPDTHNISIKKDGYFDYQKNLPVVGQSVTKLEHVILFKQNPTFDVVIDTTKSPFNLPVAPETYLIKNFNLYYSSGASQNNNLTLLQKTTPVIKNLVANKIQDNNIIWLGVDGFLYSSDLQGNNRATLSTTDLQINKKNSYQIMILNGNIFLKENTTVSLFDPTTKSFVNFYAPITDMKLSPDGQKILFYNDHEILISLLNSGAKDKTLLNRFSEKITDAQWIESDYVIFTVADKIIISEVDTRGNINTITLPQTLTLADGKKMTITNPKISFNQQDKKLYILTGNTLVSSERLVP